MMGQGVYSYLCFMVCQSIHSGKSNGLAPRIWADFDRAGFDAAQRSFINFSHNCFSKWMYLITE
jgi:hypothetical protein